MPVFLLKYKISGLRSFTDSAFHPSGVTKSSTSLSGWVITGSVHPSRVACNTLFLRMAGDAP